MPNILLQLNKNEIDLIREVATTWFKMESFNNEWLHNWEAAVKIYYRCDTWNEEKFIDIDEDIIDDFKDCIQDYVSQGYKNNIGFKKFSIGKFLFIKFFDALKINQHPGIFIPLTYGSNDNAQKIVVDPTKNPAIELAKHGIYIENNNQN